MLLAIASGCAKKKTAAATTTDENPVIGTVDTTSFWVRARTSDDFSPYTKVGDDLTSDNSFSWVEDSCELTSTDIDGGTKDIMCYIEAEELDLNFNGLTIQHNVPPGLCSYVTISMPWFYQYPVGNGASDTGYSNRTDLGTYPTARNYYFSGTTPTKKYCPFDYSQFGFAGTVDSTMPNCCLGTFRDVVHTDDGAGNTSDTITTGDWGGDIGKCINGPALDTQTLSSTGIPVPDIYYVSATGLNGVYTWPSVKTKGYSSNLYLANYHSLDTASTYDNNTTDYPAAMVPGNNIKSVAAIAGNTTWDYGPADSALTLTSISSQPFAQYICWNRNREAIARIRVQVRSWDEESNIGSATAYDADNSDMEPVPFPNLPIHDYNVWDTNNAGTFLYLPVFPYVGATSYSAFTDGYPGPNL